MKITATTILLLLSFPLLSQTSDYSGTYELKIEPINDGPQTWTLHLNQNGTFDFDYHRIPGWSIPNKEHIRGKGKWKADKNYISFTTTEKDIDATYTLDFNDAKARIIQKSPRNKSPEIVPDKILFYESGIFWLVRKTLTKV